MATLGSVLVEDVRSRLNAESDTFWTDALILRLLNLGAKDLWRRLNDLYQDYFTTLDITTMSLPASTAGGAGSVTGVPSDLFRIVMIEPRLLGSFSNNPGLIFEPAKYQDPKFVLARARGPVSPVNQTIYYVLQTQGAPVAAPVIRYAPQVTTAVNLSVLYNQTLAAMTLVTNNPIPGESDSALVAWATAYARGKQNPDGTTTPDPGWIGVYASEKANLIRELTPRQIQQPDFVQGMFEPISDTDSDPNRSVV